MKAFYEQQPGAVLSCTIDKYIYVILNDHRAISYDIRTMYDETDDVSDLNDVKSDIIRETLKYFEQREGFTIASMTDVPANGTGLGSSSAFTVGLVGCCAAANNRILTPFSLAELSCEIEINRCEHPIGKQDQYAAAMGGLNHMTFMRDGTVSLERRTAAEENLRLLEQNLLLVYTGATHSADTILRRQEELLKKDTESFKALARNAERADQAFDLLTVGDVDAIGHLLHEAWEDKKRVAPNWISNYRLDQVYNTAMSAGAFGGKIVGAGGGGFFIFYVPVDKQEQLKHELLANHQELEIFPFRFVSEGCKVVKI